MYTSLESLLKAYALTVQNFVIIAQAEEFTVAELEDLNYMEQRIDAHTSFED